jgi:rhamnulokinase
MNEAEAAGPPHAIIDLEDDRFLARGKMESRIRAYCADHGLPQPATRGEITRLILESIAESYRRTLFDLEILTGQPIDIVHIVGGGSQNELLCRLTAEASGKKVVAGPVEATAIGNLLIQMRTMGDLPVGLEIRDLVRSSFPLQSYVP